MVKKSTTDSLRLALRTSHSKGNLSLTRSSPHNLLSIPLPFSLISMPQYRFTLHLQSILTFLFLNLSSSFSSQFCFRLFLLLYTTTKSTYISLPADHRAIVPISVYVTFRLRPLHDPTPVHCWFRFVSTCS